MKLPQLRGTGDFKRLSGAPWMFKSHEDMYSSLRIDGKTFGGEYRISEMPERRL